MNGLLALAVVALPLVLAGSCAVFPDEATLPNHSGSSGAAGEGTTAQGGNAGQGGDVPPEAGRGGDDTDVGGAAGGGGTAVVAGGVGGDSAGGAGGSPCLNPQPQIALLDADTWIGSGKPTNGHASDLTLSVAAGSDEHRALIAVTLPAAPAGTVLRRATLAFRLESNAEASLAARRLGLHRLTQAFDASRTTWNNYDNGASKRWMTPGGDFGIEVGHADLRPNTASGLVLFNVTLAVRAIAGADAIPLSLIVLESSPALPVPAELAFTSAKGDTADVPRLILQYCDP